MKNVTKFLASLFSVLLFLVLFSGSAHAVYFSSGNSLTLPKDKEINETAFIAASDLTVDSDINGDLFCAGRNITVNGNIKGDVICAAQLIKINGTVDGNVRVAAQNVEINGIVTRNVLTASQTLTLAKFSTVKGDIFFGVQNVDLRGSLGRDLAGAGETVNISGSLLRNAKVTASKLAVIDPAKIGGDFEYFIDSTGTVSVNQKNIKGSIVRHEIARKELPQKETKKVSSVGMVMGKIFWMISTLLLGFTLLYLFKSTVAKKIDIIAKKPFITGLIGFAFLVLTPLVFILLLVTMIGAPLAFALILEYVVAIMMASITPTIMIGEWLIKLLSKKKAVGYSWPLVVGTIAVGLLLLVPVVGPLGGFLLLCLGLGATFQVYLPEK